LQKGGIAVDTTEIIAKLEDIQNGFLGYTPGAGFDITPGASADVRIARAVYWLEILKRRLRGDCDSSAARTASGPGDCSG
jgi:hypothetical protein